MSKPVLELIDLDQSYYKEYHCASLKAAISGKDSELKKIISAVEDGGVETTDSQQDNQCVGCTNTIFSDENGKSCKNETYENGVTCFWKWDEEEGVFAPSEWEGWC